MANLIIKASSGNNLVVQGADDSPAITVATDGATTFAEQVTVPNITTTGTATGFSSAALGTVTSGDLSNTAIVFPTGHVVQTQSTTTTTGTSGGTSSSYTAISGMTLAITPIFNNSKILIYMHTGGMVQNVVNSMYLIVYGTTTGTVMLQSRYGYKDMTGTSNWIPCPIAVATIDTPGTIATQTYSLSAKCQSLTDTGNWRFNQTEVGNTKGGSVILQEIKV